MAIVLGGDQGRSQEFPEGGDKRGVLPRRSPGAEPWWRSGGVAGDHAEYSTEQSRHRSRTVQSPIIL